MSTVARRSVVVERLRRLLFSPSKLSAVGALALTFATAAPALAQQPSGVVTGTLANQDYNVADYADSTLDLTDARYDINTNYDSTITLGGGTLKLSTGTSGPVYDAANETLYMRMFSNNVDTLTPEEEQAFAQENAYLEMYYGGPISRYVEIRGHHIDASAGGEINVSNTFDQNFDMPSYVQDALGVYMSTQKIDGNFVKSGEGTLTMLSYDAALDVWGLSQLTQTGQTQINGALTVSGGTLNIFGDGDYQNVNVDAEGILGLNFGSHTINGDLVNDGGVLLHDEGGSNGETSFYGLHGTLHNSGTLINNSTLNLATNDHVISGLVQNNNELLFYGGTYTVDGAIANNGVLAFSGNATHTFTGTGKIANNYAIVNYGNFEINGGEAKNNFAIDGDGFFYNFANVMLLNGNHTISSDLSNLGVLYFADGDDTLDGDLENMGTVDFFFGNHTVNGNIHNDTGAKIHFADGDDVINGNVYNYGELNFAAGDHVVNGNFANFNLTRAYGLHQGDATITFNGEVSSLGGRFNSWGDVAYNNDVTIRNGSANFARDINGEGQNIFADNVSLTIQQSKVTANANCLGVALGLDAGSELTYCNMTQAMETGEDNEFYLTYDERQTPTVLEWNAGRNNVATALANGNVVNKAIYSESGSEISFYTYGKENVEAGQSANGYTVVFDSNSQPDLFQHAGETYVMNAFAVVAGDTNFGVKGDKNVFNVWGESYRLVSAEEGRYEWLINTCGMLGFYRDGETDVNAAPSVTSSIVCFMNGLDDPRLPSDYIGGSRIWVDAIYRDETGAVAQVDHKLGAINANTIIFGDLTKVWYDGISSVDSDVEMTFDLNVEKTIQYGDTNAYVQGEAAALHDATKEEIESVFGAAQLVDATFAQTSADSAAGVVTVRAKNVAEYAAEQNMSERERELAAKLDSARLDGERALGFYDALYNETDQAKVTQTVHNLSLLGYNMLNAQGHFGNPTSSFFGGSTVGGEAKRGQDAERDWNALELNPQPQQSAIEQKTYSPNRSVWAAYTHTSVDGDDYNVGGVTTHGYDLKRSGIVGGIRRQVDATTSAGLFFGLSSPEIQSANALEGGYGSVGSRMEMTDFQFAGHLDKVLADVWEVNVYVGGGTQTMDWERFANFGPDAGGLYRYQADGNGNTLTGTLYLSYRADLNDAFTLRPTIGVDSEHSWLYGFSETATVAGAGSESVLLNPYMDIFAQSYSYAKTYYNRNTARAGLSFIYSHPRHGLIGLNGRVFYGVKLGGDDAPELTYYSDAYRWEDMASHEMGESSLNVGGGGFMHLNPLKTLTATGDVNAIWYKNAQTFNVTGGVSYRF